MTPSQNALRAYIAAKLQEGTFAGLSAPGEMLKKAILEVVADAPAAFGDLLGGTIGAVCAKRIAISAAYLPTHKGSATLRRGRRSRMRNANASA